MREIKTLTIQFMEWALARGHNKRLSMKQGFMEPERWGTISTAVCKGILKVAESILRKCVKPEISGIVDVS